MTGLGPDELPPGRVNRLTRRNFLLGSGAVAAGMAIYSSEVARHEISIVTQTIRVPRLPEAFHGYRIAQISDIHFEEFTDAAFLRRMVEHVNLQAPDLVAVTGDFVSYGPLPYTFSRQAAYRCAEILRGIACPARYGILGNHDVTVGSAFVVDAATGAGIKMLLNQFVAIERGGQHLWLSGVLDPASDFPDLHQALPADPDAPVVLLCHCPDYADKVVNHPLGRFVDLMLSGHSHGGQVRLPVVGPMILPAWGEKYVEGLYRFGRLHLYVNRGLGTTGVPFRLNCPPEITVFTLQSS